MEGAVSDSEKVFLLETLYSNFKKMGAKDGLLEENPSSSSNPTGDDTRMTKEQLHFTKKTIKMYRELGAELHFIVETPKYISKFWIPEPSILPSNDPDDNVKYIGFGKADESPMSATLQAGEDAGRRLLKNK